MNRHERRSLASQGLPIIGQKPPDPLPARPSIKVAVLVPSGDEICAGMAMQLVTLCAYSVKQGIAVGLQNFRGSSISHSRNSLVELSLPHGPDFLFWLDSDMIFPPDALVRLLNHQKDIVGATYCKRAPPYNLLGQSLNPDLDLSDKHGLEGMAFMPGGCMLVSTSVYKAMPWPHYFESYHRYNHPGPNKPSPQEAFLQMIDDSLAKPLWPKLRARLAADEELMTWVEDASKLELTTLTPKYIGEDYSFAKKARAMGFEIWCDLDLTRQLGHIGEQIVTLGPKAGTVAPVETENANVSD